MKNSICKFIRRVFHCPELKKRPLEQKKETKDELIIKYLRLPDAGKYPIKVVSMSHREYRKNSIAPLVIQIHLSQSQILDHSGQILDFLNQHFEMINQTINTSTWKEKTLVKE